MAVNGRYLCVLEGKDKTAYTAALGAFGQRRKEYHQAVETLREHRAKHGC